MQEWYEWAKYAILTAEHHDGVWEYCHTFNESWGYQGSDHKYKDVIQVIKLFMECISMGGNMLIGAYVMINGIRNTPRKITSLKNGRELVSYGVQTN